MACPPLDTVRYRLDLIHSALRCKTADPPSDFTVVNTHTISSSSINACRLSIDRSLRAAPVIWSVASFPSRIPSPRVFLLTTGIYFGTLIQPSNGRGGLGNYRSSSREYRASHDGPEDFSDTRGRDKSPIHSCDPDVVCNLLPLLMLLLFNTQSGIYET